MDSFKQVNTKTHPTKLTIWQGHLFIFFGATTGPGNGDEDDEKSEDENGAEKLPPPRPRLRKI